MISLHDFLSCFSVMILYQSQMIFMFFFMFLVMFFFMTFYHMIFMFSRHDFLSNNLHVSLHVSRHVSLHVSLYDFLSNDLHVFSSWLSIKKIMQKSKIFLYLTFWYQAQILDELNQVDSILSWVESCQVENMRNLTWIKLKMWATQLWIESNSKCQFKT